MGLPRLHVIVFPSCVRVALPFAPNTTPSTWLFAHKAGGRLGDLHGITGGLWHTAKGFRSPIPPPPAPTCRAMAGVLWER